MSEKMNISFCKPSILSLLICSLVAASFNAQSKSVNAKEEFTESPNALITAYRKPLDAWPPAIQVENLKITELGSINAYIAQIKEFKENNADKVRLGKQLFFDPRLSRSNQIACASCHDAQLGWTDGKRKALGHNRQQGLRNSMSLLNVSAFQPLFWDGRAQSLQHQALMPIQDSLEMHSTLPETLSKLNQITGYRQQFAAIYQPQQVNTIISAEQLADALASFQKTLVSRPSRFDRFVEGDYQQLNDREINGLHLFRTKARCIVCHQGTFLTDNKFHHTGLSYYGRKFEDLGRFNSTAKEEDKGLFRTPGLRGIKHTGPYMHNGLFPSIRGVLNMYNAGMTFRKKLKPGEPALSSLIQPLNLTKNELQDLELFLLTLSSENSRYVAAPTLPN
jgi:cytochrome c peroxidase